MLPLYVAPLVSLDLWPCKDPLVSSSKQTAQQSFFQKDYKKDRELNTGISILLKFCTTLISLYFKLLITVKS